ncbi:YciI family protein [Ochrobactrum sp. A-1]|uniref:YciI family protein n=1 Tax=Ochrobactrum sp. A-1 TaxID=2920940 RepID=UPI001F0A2D44|nr:YciI family protein [Ochrobactrum sp. A-1]
MAFVPDGYNAFIVDLNYIVSLDRVDAAISDHVAFLKKNYASGVFLTSGRKVPRTGGIIIAVAENKGQLLSILDEDPFLKLGLAQYTITEFVPSMWAPQFE